MGPDRDDGLPSDKRGTIKRLVGTHTELLAAVDSTTAPAAQGSDDIPFQWGSSIAHGSHVIDPRTASSAI